MDFPKKFVERATNNPIIPVIDLSKSDTKHQIVKACEEFGFFKVRNHGIPMDCITKLESEASNFFALTLSDKKRVSSPYPYKFGNVIDEYITTVKNMACNVLELMADGLRILPRDVLSKLVMDEHSASFFRINHYLPFPAEYACKDQDFVGFGEHTDPQIISVLSSNNISGFEIYLRDGKWVSVAPDPTSYFINVGDCLEVMTNGMFKSLRHRVVVANNNKSRLSMIYFGAPPLSEKIVPLPSLMGVDQTPLYKEFTWEEYSEHSRTIFYYGGPGLLA